MQSGTNKQIQSLFYYKNQNGKDWVEAFQCKKCGCKVCDRPKEQIDFSFLQGYFVCRNCKNESVCYDEDFTGSEFVQAQLEISFNF